MAEILATGLMRFRERQKQSKSAPSGELPLDFTPAGSVCVTVNQTFDACVAKFNNAVNFRGEPYVPGMDRLLATAATANDLQRS